MHDNYLKNTNGSHRIRFGEQSAVYEYYKKLCLTAPWKAETNTLLWTVNKNSALYIFISLVFTVSSRYPMLEVLLQLNGEISTET